MKIIKAVSLTLLAAIFFTLAACTPATPQPEEPGFTPSIDELVGCYEGGFWEDYWQVTQHGDELYVVFTTVSYYYEMYVPTSSVKIDNAAGTLTFSAECEGNKRYYGRDVGLIQHNFQLSEEGLLVTYVIDGEKHSQEYLSNRIKYNILDLYNAETAAYSYLSQIKNEYDFVHSTVIQSHFAAYNDDRLENTFYFQVRQEYTTLNSYGAREYNEGTLTVEMVDGTFTVTGIKF